MQEIIYSVSIKVNIEIRDEFIHWLKSEHIAEVVNTGCFDSAKFFELLDANETDGATINIQYSTSSFERYLEYVNKYSAEMRKKGFDKFGDAFVGFRSVLKGEKII